MTTVVITADTSQAERQIANLERALKDINGAASLAAKGLGVIAAAGAAMSAAIGLSIGRIGDLDDAAKALGISAQNLQYLQQSAQLAGVSADELNASLRKMQANLGDAFVKGAGPAVDALNKLGISASEIVNLGADEQMKLLGDAIREIPNPTERSAAAVALLGKNGTKLLAAADNAARVKEEMEALGLALSDLDVELIGKAGDSFDEMAAIIKGGVNKAAAELAPYIIAIANEIKEAIKDAGGFEGIMRKIRDALELATKAAAVFATFWAAGAITAGVVAAYSAMLQMYTAIKVATGAASVLNAVLGKNPIIKIVGALVSIGGAVVAVEAVDDLFGELDKKAASIKTNVEAQIPAKKAVAVAAQQYNEAEEKALIALGESLTKLYTSVEYQKDINQYGEEEADIRKAIKEEQEKLAKVGLTLTDQQEQLIRGGYTQLKQQKDITALAKEQAQAITSNILGQQSPFEQALQKQLDFRLLMEGKTSEQIKKIREQEIKDNPQLAVAAQKSLDRNVQQAIDAEIGKGNKLYGIKQRQQKELQDLLDIELTAQVNGYKLSGDQIAALEVAKTELMKSQQLERLEFDKQIAEKRVQLELDRIQRVLTAEQGAVAKALSTRDQEVLQRIGNEERTKAIVTERIAFEKKSELEKYQFGIQSAAEMYSALGAQNKKAFEAAKAFNIANAVMNTYMAATKALATYPPPFNFIAAAAAVGMGLAQVAQIRAQSYSGRALGGPVMGGTPYIVGERGPELFTPNTTGRITPNNQLSGGTTNVNFTIVANDAQGFDDLLLQRRGMITQMISDARLEQGMRA